MLGALDLFAFCFLVIFGNVLDFRTYTNPRGEPLENVLDYDQNGIAVEERINMCQARGVCLEILRWWNSKYSAEGWSGIGLFTTHLLISQAMALINYKARVDSDNREGAPGCAFSMLLRQIKNALILVVPLGENPTEVIMHWRSAGRKGISGREGLKLGFSIKDWEHIRIVERVPPYIYCKYYSADTSRPDLISSQTHPAIFSYVVLHHLTRRSWSTRVLRCGR